MLAAEDVEMEIEYGKIDDKLSYVGGLFEILLVMIGFFLLSFNEYRYELFIGETFSFEDGKKVKEKDFTFFQYLKYACYDWVRTFGCCQPDWEECKKIEEARE